AEPPPGRRGAPPRPVGGPRAPGPGASVLPGLLRGPAPVPALRAAGAGRRPRLLLLDRRRRRRAVGRDVAAGPRLVPRARPPAAQRRARHRQPAAPLRAAAAEPGRPGAAAQRGDGPRQPVALGLGGGAELRPGAP